MNIHGGPGLYACKLCRMDLMDRASLVEHLRTVHEPLEIVSYAAVTMADEQARDAAALDFHRRFEGLKRIIDE
jgi:hypothetical protein